MTNKVGIIGWPLEHSLSPVMHNAAFAALGMDWHYELMAIPPDILRLGLREPQRHGFVGINVTIPHKEKVMAFVRPDARARAIGAVNTIDLRDNSATNTDVVGLVEDLKAHGVILRGARTLVLGAGGAARAAVYGLALEGALVTVVNRTMERAQVMLADLTLSSGIKDVRVMTLDDAADIESGGAIDLIVNCTSAGMWPQVDESPWISGVPFPRRVVVYDMVYRPEVTVLMRQAEAAGGRAIGGLGMLVRQGAESFRLWTGVMPPTEVMFAAAQSALRKKTS